MFLDQQPVFPQNGDLGEDSLDHSSAAEDFENSQLYQYSEDKGNFVNQNGTGRGGRRVGAGRKRLPEELKRQRRAMRKQITVSWNLCQEWESLKSEFGIGRDREFLHYLLKNCRRDGTTTSLPTPPGVATNPTDPDNPLGTMPNFISYINQLRAQDKLTDVTLVVKDPTGTKTVSVHKLILSMTSHYFKSLSQADLKRKHEFYLEDVTADGLRLLLDYMYGLPVDYKSHYQYHGQIVHAATVLQVDCYLHKARSIAKRGRKLLEEPDQNLFYILPEPNDTFMLPTHVKHPENDTNAGPVFPEFFHAANTTEQFTDQTMTETESITAAAASEESAYLSEKTATFAAGALDDAFLVEQNAKPAKPELKCDICSKTFPHRILLNRHERLTHNFKYMTGLSKKRKFLSYLKSSTTSTPAVTFRCKLCKCVFLSDVDLRKHKSTVHKYIKVSKRNRTNGSAAKATHKICSVCDEKFKSKSELKMHIISTHRVKTNRHKCTKCARTFSVQESLQRHMKYKHKIGKKRAEPTPKIAEATNTGVVDVIKGSVLFDSIPALHTTPSQPTQPRAGKKAGQWICHICSFAYNQRSLLMKHLQIIHNVNPGNQGNGGNQGNQGGQQTQNGDSQPQNNAEFQHEPLRIDESIHKVPNMVTFADERQSWRCHLCDLPFGFRWSLLRHLELVHRVVGTHLEIAEKTLRHEDRSYGTTYQNGNDQPSPGKRSRTIRQMIADSEEQKRYQLPPVTDESLTIKEILERKIRTKEDDETSLRKLEDRFGSSALARGQYDPFLTSKSSSVYVANLTSQTATMPTYYQPSLVDARNSDLSRSSTPPEPSDYDMLASPQQLTAMVQAPLLPFTTSPTTAALNPERSFSPGQDSEHILDEYGRLIPRDQDLLLPPLSDESARYLGDKNAARRHRLTGRHEPVPQPPKLTKHVPKPQTQKVLSTRMNIQRPAYSQMTFKLVKTNKKDASGESELKLWPQQREVFDCTGCGMAFSRYPSYAKHVIKCQGKIPEQRPNTVTEAPSDDFSTEPVTAAPSISRPRQRSRSNKVKQTFKHYDFKEYFPPENNFKYQYSV